MTVPPAPSTLPTRRWLWLWKLLSPFHHLFPLLYVILLSVTRIHGDKTYQLIRLEGWIWVGCPRTEVSRMPGTPGRGSPTGPAARRWEARPPAPPASSPSPMRVSPSTAAHTNQCGFPTFQDITTVLSVSRGSGAPEPGDFQGWCSTKRDINGLHVSGPTGDHWVSHSLSLFMFGLLRTFSPPILLVTHPSSFAEVCGLL